ncbi:MAG: hypothetical protein IJR87_01390 [Bacteroidaceae bacterium]|nr:hypothetical protein [Bacteroidaceae bacterium]
MTITITEKEYDAIAFALTQIGTEVEAASDETYIADAGECCDALYKIMERYKKARYKAREFQNVRAVVAERNRGRCIRPRDIDKMARIYLRQLKKDGRL